jgi:hypothetical protein
MRGRCRSLPFAVTMFLELQAEKERLRKEGKTRARAKHEADQRDRQLSGQVLAQSQQMPSPSPLERSSHDGEDFENFNCRHCRAAGYNRQLLCEWREREPLVIVPKGRDQKGERTPEILPFCAAQGDMADLLPTDEPLAYLRDRVRQWGTLKPVCPVPLAWHPDLELALNLEADLDTWHLPPLPGPSREWPRALLDVLRHVRGISNLLERRAIREMEKEQS